MSRLSRHSEANQEKQESEQEDNADDDDAEGTDFASLANIGPDPELALLIQKKSKRNIKRKSQFQRLSALTSASNENNGSSSSNAAAGEGANGELQETAASCGFKYGRRGGNSYERNAGTIVKDASLQVSELGSDHPLVRVGNELHIGVWEDTVGTDLLVNSSMYIFSGFFLLFLLLFY